MEMASLTAPEIRQRIWVELQRATQDRHHEWRTPVLATTGADGLPNARTVVLRYANAKLGILQMYTDSRSPKVAELLARPQVMLAFWSKRLSWQLRVRATTFQPLPPGMCCRATTRRIHRRQRCHNTTTWPSSQRT